MRTFCTGRFEMAEGELLLMINNTFALHFLQATHSENSVNRVWKALAVQPGSAEDGVVCGLQAPTEWDGKSVLRMQISLLTLKACVCE